MSDVNFPVTHPQYLGDLDPTGPEAREALKDADLMVGIGCPMFGQSFYSSEPTLPGNLRFIQIDENPWEIGKNFPVDCGIQGDIKAALSELNNTLNKRIPDQVRKSSKARIDLIAEEKAARENLLKYPSF